jgi:hypothetical protein
LRLCQCLLRNLLVARFQGQDQSELAERLVTDGHRRGTRLAVPVQHGEKTVSPFRDADETKAALNVGLSAK